MDGQKLAELEYEALQAEKRDKLNGRVQIWSLFFGLVSGAGLVSVQAGTVSSLIALYPFLAMCLARYTGHSERVLDQLKGRLLAIERARGFMGYEEVNRGNARHRQDDESTESVQRCGPAVAGRRDGPGGATDAGPVGGYRDRAGRGGINAADVVLVERLTGEKE